MSIHSSSDDNFLQINAKKNLDYCEKFFVENVGNNFADHLEAVIQHIKSKVNNAKSFSEKQLINDLVKKLTVGKHEISNHFKDLLKRNIKSRLINKSLMSSKMSWQSLNLSDKVYEEEELAVLKFEQNIDITLGEELKSLVKGTNYLANDNKDLFTADVLSHTLVNVLKQHFTNIKTLCVGIVSFAEIWPALLLPYYQKLNKYLVDNDIFSKMETQKPVTQEKIVLKNLVPDFNSFLTQVAEEELEKIQQNVVKSPEELQREKELEDERLALELEQDVKNFALETEETLVSQQHMIEPINIHELMNKPLIAQPTPKLFSKILTNPSFLKTINGLQTKFFKITPEIFKKNELEKKSVLFEMMQNKSLSQHMNAYDLFIFRILCKTYDSIFYNEALQLEHKVILYKTQLFILQVALARKSFLFDKSNPARIFLEFCINSETILNTKLLTAFDKIISEIETPEKIDTEFFINMINSMTVATQKELNEQQNIIKQSLAQIEKEESIDFYYYKLLNVISPISAKTDYEPLKHFIEKVWTFNVVKKLVHKELDLSILLNSDFVQHLPAEIKTNWQQSLHLFELMIAVANNFEHAPEKIAKLQAAIPKINEGLAKISYDLGIEEKHTKTLFTFLKFKLEVMSKTTNHVQIDNALQQMKPSESAFLTEMNASITSVVALDKANVEIAKINFNMSDFLQVNSWFSLNRKTFKLLYISPKNNNYILFSPENNTIHCYTKAKIWYLIKNKALQNINDNYLFLNFLNFLVQSNKELIH